MYIFRYMWRERRCEIAREREGEQDTRENARERGKEREREQERERERESKKERERKRARESKREWECALQRGRFRLRERERERERRGGRGRESEREERKILGQRKAIKFVGPITHASSLLSAQPNHLCSLPGCQISKNHFTYRSVLMYKVMRYGKQALCVP